MNTLTDTQRWQIVLDRDARYRGQFVLAVRTTGIYCQPACPARTPKRENIAFYETPAQAEAAGFRPCKRCRPHLTADEAPHLALVAQVCRALEAELDAPPSLAELARRFHLSPYHLQRTFKRTAGVTPKQYVLGLRANRLRAELRQGRAVTTAAQNAGYNGSSQVYDQPVLGMTPTTYQQGGAAEQITYAVVVSPLGHLLVAATARGVCAVKLGDDAEALAAELRAEFPAASAHAPHPQLGQWVQAVVDYLRGEQPHLDLPTDVRATAFQRRVWAALRRIPLGQTRSYSAVARALGQPTATRAVARACATNPVALVVPCHRVVGANGALTGYRWGVERKRQLLAQEAALAAR